MAENMTARQLLGRLQALPDEDMDRTVKVSTSCCGCFQDVEDGELEFDDREAGRYLVIEGGGWMDAEDDK